MATTNRPRTAVTIVHAPACHFCEDAQHALAELAGEYPLTVHLIDAADEEGQALIAQHRAPMFPLVLIDGEFFSFGRLPRKKLGKLLEARAAAAVA